MSKANLRPSPLPLRKGEGESASVGSRAGRLRLRLTAAAETIVRGGHPWVFADSVREQNREGTPGELAVIYDRKDSFLAVGLFDPDSPIRVRVLHAGKPQTVDAAWWAAQLDAAVRRRDGLFDERTTGCRLINGESDGWPGLVLDRYDTTLVLKVYAAVWLPRLQEVLTLIWERMTPERIVLRMSRNIQRGADPLGGSPHPVPLHEPGSGTGVPPLRIEANGRDARATTTAPVQGFRASVSRRIWREGECGFQRQAGSETGAPVVFLETGLRFEADVVRGQKTGFFLDQRENRRMVETLARGRAILNVFSFSGGFSLYAARGGAKSVTDLDISRHALESARRNFALNQADEAIARCGHAFVQADAFAWLAGNPGQKFDLIVLEPPSLAKREAERAGAIRAYGKLAEDGMQHLAPGGILVACSCSAHVSAEEFFGTMRQAARNSGRKFAELQTTRHAPDHHATFAEAEYLKGIYLRMA